jgi:hypothetical protein
MCRHQQRWRLFLAAGGKGSSLRSCTVLKRSGFRSMMKMARAIQTGRTSMGNFQWHEAMTSFREFKLLTSGRACRSDEWINY